MADRAASAMSKPSSSPLVLALCVTLLSILTPLVYLGQGWTDFVWRKHERCESPVYDVRIVSWDPVVLHLENFVTKRERRALIEQAKPLLRVSDVRHPNGSRSISDYRRSSTALLEAASPAVKCVRQRIASFQGFVADEDIESLQVTWYEGGGYFKLHHDWSPNDTNVDATRSTRATTGFISLDADCRDCGTQFPFLKTQFMGNNDDPWCRILDCSERKLTVRPLPGSMLFWQNKNLSGHVDPRMLHQGLPVSPDNFKIGLNIWTSLDHGKRVVAKDSMFW